MEHLQTIEDKSVQFVLNKYIQLPDNLQLQMRDYLDFLFQKYVNSKKQITKKNKLDTEDAQAHSTFKEWNEALQKIDNRKFNENILEYDTSLSEYRKKIWDMEQSEDLTFEEGKKQIELCLEKL